MALLSGSTAETFNSSAAKVCRPRQSGVIAGSRRFEARALRRKTHARQAITAVHAVQVAGPKRHNAQFLVARVIKNSWRMKFPSKKPAMSASHSLRNVA